MDGTLLDSETWFARAMFSAAEDFGVAMTEELHRSLIGCPRDESDRKILATFGSAFPLQKYHDACHSAFDRLCREHIPLRPGARELLGFLKSAGIPRAVATSAQRDSARRSLERGGVLHLFDAVVTRSDVSQGKPHPESFLRAAELLKARPAHCLAVEDSYLGVRAASAAGMATVMIPDMLPATEEMHSLCAAVMDSLHHLHAALRPQ